MDLQGATIAVTGATGFLGSHIALALAACGARVVGVVRTPAKGAWLARHGVALVRADLLDRGSLVAAFRGADAVVSNAALGSGQGSLAELERVNGHGAANVVEAQATAGVPRLVHISTVAVYRTRLWRRMDEETPRNPTDRRRFNWNDATTDWRYTRTKTLAERIVRERAEALGIGLTCLRPGPVYGARDPKATARLVAALRRPLVIAPTVGVPWVHAGDVAQAVAGALANPAAVGKAYNLAGEPVSQWRFLRAMRRQLGGGARLLPLPLPVWVRYDTTAARRELGFSPRAIEDGLAEALAAYRAPAQGA